MNLGSRVRMASRACVAALLLTVALLATATTARADYYDSAKAGHPLRITAYVLHPIGVMFDVLIFRPAHWVGSHETLRTLFGHTER